MIKLIFNGEEIECTKAIKGTDFIQVFDGENVIAEFSGISDFAGYTLEGGEFSLPAITDKESIEILATIVEGLI